MENEFKYSCDKCNYNCNYDSEWLKHCNTELHKTGKRKTRSDLKEPLKCKNCLYTTKNKTMMKQHILNMHSTKEQREKEFKFYCKCCDFGTFSNDLFQKHEESTKHKNYITIS
jgi:hypothetical protein